MSFRTWLIRRLGGTPNDPRDIQLKRLCRQLGKTLPEKFEVSGARQPIYNVPGHMSAAAAVCGMKGIEHGPINKLLSNIKEVQEGGKKLANWYLAHGYMLLDIQTGARADWNPRSAANGQMCYVRRNPVYVMGRPDGVLPAPRMPGAVTPGETPAEKSPGTDETGSNTKATVPAREE